MKVFFLIINSAELPERPYRCFPGFFREEAILLLRKFYVQENEKAPTPRGKKLRELKTNIDLLDYSNYVISEEEFVEVYGEEKVQDYRQSLLKYNS